MGAHITLAIEPCKKSLYSPALRIFCGSLVHVEGIFPRDLLENYSEGAELYTWDDACRLIPPLTPWAYKYKRGVAEIHAGSAGAAGAARIAAAGAMAGGAGLVRLMVPQDIYSPVLANPGVMTVPETLERDSRFFPDALLLGPGWGRGEAQRSILRSALELEKQGVPLVLDADAIALAKDTVFNGRTILTPHAGELEAYTGVPKERLLAEPEVLQKTAKEKNALILFKSHVMIAASPDGRLLYIDGFEPVLGAGGSGDLLAGFCAALCARLHALEPAPAVYPPDFAEDDCLRAAAAAAAALRIASARRRGRVFSGPLELAAAAGELAGEAWLPKGIAHGRT
jgi:NAD(P)H-hydrate epimerase